MKIKNYKWLLVDLYSSENADKWSKYLFFKRTSRGLVYGMILELHTSKRITSLDTPIIRCYTSTGDFFELRAKFDLMKFNSIT